MHIIRCNLYKLYEVFHGAKSHVYATVGDDELTVHVAQDGVMMLDSVGVVDADDADAMATTKRSLNVLNGNKNVTIVEGIDAAAGKTLVLTPKPMRLLKTFVAKSWSSLYGEDQAPPSRVNVLIVEGKGECEGEGGDGEEGVGVTNVTIAKRAELLMNEDGPWFCIGLSDDEE